jgi:hypothetical protein
MATKTFYTVHGKRVYHDRYHTGKNGQKNMSLEPKFDIGRAGKTKAIQPVMECCMGKELRKGYSKGRGKKRRQFNIMMRKSKSENEITKRLKKVDTFIC